MLNGVPGGNLYRPEVNAITDIAGMGVQQVQPGLCNHAVLSDGSRSIDKKALSEFLDRYSRPKTGAASCWDSRLMNSNWMCGQSFQHAVRAPPFPGGNLNQNIYQYYCRTDIPFICYRCSLGNGSRLWRWFLVSRKILLEHRALFLAWTNRFLINQL